MKESNVWFIVSQVWLAAATIATTGWQAAACVILGSAWFCGSLLLNVREKKHV